jgi:hypothetical protein
MDEGSHPWLPTLLADARDINRLLQKRFMGCACGWERKPQRRSADRVTLLHW